jgi:hypothetical protein
MNTKVAPGSYSTIASGSVRGLEYTGTYDGDQRSADQLNRRHVPAVAAGP